MSAALVGSIAPVGSMHRDGVIRVAQTAEIGAVSLEGDFDMANAPAIDDEIDRVLETGNDLILDLSEATFIDSSVIEILVRAAKAVGGGTQTLVLQLGTAAVVERVLDIVEIEHVLTRAHDRQEAVRIIRQRPEIA